MDTKDIANHVNILHSELYCALGCTEPIAIAYAAALSRSALTGEAKHIEVHCSANIIKNVMAVTVPNSGGRKGIEVAAILGCLGGDETRALETLETVDDSHREKLLELLDSNFCEVHLKEGVSNLYVQCICSNATHESRATIQDRHTNVIELISDGKSLLNKIDSEDSCSYQESKEVDRSSITFSSIWEFIHEVELSHIEEIIEQQITYNSAISDEGLKHDWGCRIGKTIRKNRPDTIQNRAISAAAAGSDARMGGCAMPVVIVCGSGNQGMATCLPVVEYAKELGASKETLIRAVALSDLIAIHIKYYIGALSAFCGAVSAAAGAGAAICYLKGGGLDEIGSTVINTLANVGGIICDGAKSSCAAKIASSVDAALLAVDMAFDSLRFEKGEGIVAEDVEKTIRNMGHVGRVGMKSTDVEVLNLMIGKTIV